MANSNKIIASVEDARGRPLLTLMRTKKGTLVHVFKRYKDMGVADKKMLMARYRRLASGVSGEVLSVGSEKEMADFLDFKENRPCG